MKKWKCTVCGYIHVGETPPEKCPVCGADRTKFIELVEEEPVTETEAIGTSDQESGGASMALRILSLASLQVTRLHAHPISVHIPNGVLPVAVLFLIMSVSFELPTLALASFYNMVVVALAMPFVILFGFIDWKRRFHGNLTPVFITKIGCGAFLTIAGILVVIWRMINPDVAGPESAHRAAFLLVHLMMLAAAVLAGYLGGKLIFKK